jgi:hypothetical protein
MKRLRWLAPRIDGWLKRRPPSLTGATFEIATAEVTFCLHMSDHRLDGGAPSELAFEAAEDPAFLA